MFLPPFPRAADLCAVVAMTAAQPVASMDVSPDRIPSQEYSQCRSQGNINMPPRNKAVALFNVAYGKPATQSSDFNTAHFPASKAVSGVGSHDSDFLYAFSSTKLEANPWWQVDLEDNYIVDTIRVYNRYDCCPERLGGFTVTLYNEHQNATRVFQGPTNTTDMTGSIDFNLLDVMDTQNLLQDSQWCFPTRYVKIELQNNFLSLREVQVLALDRTTKVTKDQGQPLVELEYGDEMQLFLQGNINPKVLSGGHGPEQVLVATQPPQPEVHEAETFRVRWNVGDGSRDWALESKGKCVRYGDKVLLQSMAADDRFLSFISDFRQSTQTLPATQGRLNHRFWWVFRSIHDDQRDPLVGECVRQGATVYLQIDVYHWLRGGYNTKVHSQSRTIAIYGNVQKFQWNVNILKLVADPVEMEPVPGIAGRWVDTVVRTSTDGCNCEKLPAAVRVPDDALVYNCKLMWEKYDYCIV